MSGVFFQRGGGRCCRGKNRKFGILIMIVLYKKSWSLAVSSHFLMKTDKCLSFFLTVIYVCKELSLSINFSRFSVFSNISKRNYYFATILYPCITLIHCLKNTHLTFGLTCLVILPVANTIIFNVEESVVLLISTA